MSKVTFYYNQGADKRIPFAKAVADILGVKARYTGVPKCAYIIDFATVTREGNIEADDQTDNAKLVSLFQKLSERGYVMEQTDTSDTVAAPQAPTMPPAGLEAESEASPSAPTLPQPEQQEAQQVTPSAEQPALQPVVEFTDTPIAQTVAAVQEQPTVPEQNQTAESSDETDGREEETTMISVPRDSFTDVGLDNLQKILHAKGELIRMALDIETTDIEVTDEKVNFPWFHVLNEDEVIYISQFISGLCEFANISKRITSKQKRLDNPKFAMRTWAIRLGFGGAEHKDLRKFLMKRLPGDAAWRFGKPEDLTPKAPTLPLNVQVIARGVAG